MEHTSQVILISHNQHHTEVCASAARISTTQGDAAELFEKAAGNEKNSPLIGKVLQSGHKSVIEHAIFTFAFRNVSAFVEQFFIESRLASFTVKSRRYVDFSKQGYYIPGELPEDAHNRYCAYMDLLFDGYQRLLDLDIPREDARFVLPYSFHSNFYCTLNARELAHIIQGIRKGRGQGITELSQIADSMTAQVLELFPAMEAEFRTKPAHISTGTHTETAASIPGEERIFSDTHAGAVTPVPNTDKDTGIHSSSASQASENAGTDSAAISDVFCVKDTAEFIPAADIGAVALLNVPAEPAAILDLACALSQPGSKPDYRRLVTSDRPRELEQLSYCFRISDLTLSGITHLVRHRMQSILVPSISGLNHSRFILPDTISGKPEAEKLYRSTLEAANDLLLQFGNDPALRPYSHYFAVSGNMMDILTTMNARELLHFLKLRTCSRAQWEIRDISIDLLLKLRESFPELFCLYGPSCFVTGRCPEGRMTCGKINEIRKQFS